MSEISVAHVGHKIAEMTGQPGPSYQQIRNLVLRGVVPSTFKQGRWYVAEADIVKVAQAFGISIPDDVSVAA